MKKAVIFLAMFALVLMFVSPAMSGENATEQECVTMCKKAAQMIIDEGLDAAIVALNDPKGPFVWKDTYIFLMESDTTILRAHPMKPALIGKNLIGMRDVNGKMFFVELSNYANSKAGQGWVEYMWPKPGEKKSSPKKTFIYKVPGLKYAVGAGIYY